MAPPREAVMSRPPPLAALASLFARRSRSVGFAAVAAAATTASAGSAGGGSWGATDARSAGAAGGAAVGAAAAGSAPRPAKASAASAGAGSDAGAADGAGSDAGAAAKAATGMTAAGTPAVLVGTADVGVGIACSGAASGDELGTWPLPTRACADGAAVVGVRVMSLLGGAASRCSDRVPLRRPLLGRGASAVGAAAFWALADSLAVWWLGDTRCGTPGVSVVTMPTGVVGPGDDDSCSG